MPTRVRDTLDHWRCHGTITPEQFRAGQRFLGLYDATLGGRAAVDPERIKVDGGLGRGPAAERIAIARSELEAIKAEIGTRDYALLCRVLGTGSDLKADYPEEVERKYNARRIRDALWMIALRDAIEVPGA